MSDLEDIFEGIAANLQTLVTAGVVKQAHPFALANPTPPIVMVAGLDTGGIEYTTFGGPEQPSRMRHLVMVEAWAGKASDIGSQRILRRLQASHGDTSLVEAVEAAGTSRARLTSRLDHDGNLLEDQSPACESIAFEEYRGQSNFVGDNGVMYLVANWVFEVLS